MGFSRKGSLVAGGKRDINGTRVHDAIVKKAENVHDTIANGIELDFLVKKETLIEGHHRPKKKANPAKNRLTNRHALKISLNMQGRFSDQIT